MKSRAFRRTRLAAAVGAALLSLSAGSAFGSAFALQEQNASGLGHAYAGGAAAAEDVSTIFFNPAGLVRLQTTQAVVAGNVICFSAKFRDNGSQPAALQPLGGTGGEAGKCALVPNLYVGIPFTDKWSFGLGINAPFGLETKYDSDWLGRFQAVESKLETINVNPVLSWEPTKYLTVGGGVSWQRVKATLSKHVNYAGIFATQGVGPLVASGQLPAAAAPVLIGSAFGLESEAKVTGNDSGWGWNTGWSSIQELKIVRSTGVVLSNTPENFRDTWRASVGANYRYSDQWIFRGGLAYDQSPVRDAQRTPRLPDNDRTWVALGAQYRFSPSLAIDVAWAYIFVRDPSMNQNDGSTATNGLISGSYRSNVNIVGLQLTYTAK